MSSSSSPEYPGCEEFSFNPDYGDTDNDHIDIDNDDGCDLVKADDHESSYFDNVICERKHHLNNRGKLICVGFFVHRIS